MSLVVAIVIVMDTSTEAGHWNHRVLRHTHVIDGEEHLDFSVHEVYYGAKGDPVSWTARAVGISGDTWIEACDTHAIMGRAFALPVLAVVGNWLVERGDRK